MADDFSRAALNAIEAGFDGVEIHSANGYLFDQFLNARLNTRCDRYGGRRVVDRTRFVIEVVDAVADAIGASRIGVRLSPGGTESDMPLCEKSEETLFYLASELSRRQIAYLHIVDQKPPSMRLIGEYSILRRLRRRFDGLIILAGNLDLETGNILVNEGLIDVVAIGRAFISNPDLVRRLAQGLPLAPIPESGIYGGGAEGYIDYPPYSP